MTKKLLEVPPIVVAIDPGGTTGWAMFQQGELVLCGYGSFDKIAVQRLDQLFSLEEPAWLRLAARGGGVCVVEFPQAYPGPKSKQDPNHIIRTAYRCGELANPFRRLGFVVEEVYPNGWKGTADKKLTLERVLDRLTEREKSLLEAAKPAKSKSKSLDHNMIDAVGIGLWRVYRRLNTI